MGANKVSSISQADTLEKRGSSDTHDFTDFDHRETPDVEFRLPAPCPLS